MKINGYTIAPNANLRKADLQGAYLRGAYLLEANLQGAYLRRANLRGAYLREADLLGADLQEANLQGADLKDARLNSCVGNEHEIISVQVPPYNLVINLLTQEASIGCLTFKIKQWLSLTTQEIKQLEIDAAEFETRWGNIIRSILKQYVYDRQGV